MILTQCAVCATELGTGGKRCGRCSTRYCGPACQKQHWDSGGHDKLCKKIKKGGGAELYHAGKKLKEAVAVAVEKCAADTKGQTCYICTQALHWKTKEGLVRMCACRGTAGFAHVSCLAEQAKILFAEAEENNLGWEVKNPRFARWYACSMCEQHYHGVVQCALGWACWKTHVGRPEGDQARRLAMNVLGNGLNAAKHDEAALSVREVELATERRLGISQHNILVSLGNLASSYQMASRLEDALRMRQEVYAGHLKLNGEEHHQTLLEASNYASTLVNSGRFGEAKSLLRKTIPVARRVLGESNDLTLRMRLNYAGAVCRDDGLTVVDLREAVTTYEDMDRIARRVLGSAHPTTEAIGLSLRSARAMLRAHETPSGST
jgi:hypothetical protein